MFFLAGMLGLKSLPNPQPAPSQPVVETSVAKTIKKTPKPSPTLKPTPTPEPTATPVSPMTITPVGLHEWDVFIPEVGKWFDTGVPVITGQQIYIATPPYSGNPNVVVKFGGQTFYNVPGISFSRQTNEFCSPNFPADMKDTIKIRIEPGFEPRTFKFRVNHFWADGECLDHFAKQGIAQNDSEMHRLARNWWEEKQAQLGRN